MKLYVNYKITDNTVVIVHVSPKLSIGNNYYTVYVDAGERALSMTVAAMRKMSGLDSVVVDADIIDIIKYY